jgi:hypothetical protein
MPAREANGALSGGKGTNAYSLPSVQIYCSFLRLLKNESRLVMKH